MSVTTTPLITHQITIKNSQGVAVVGSPIVTNSVGHAEIDLPPGKYTVEIATLSGYSMFSNGLIEHGGAPIVTTSLITTDVDISSNEDTVINAVFQNVV